MAKTFLRSGNLDAVLALGENGQPVYLSALQLRETLRLRKQQKLADCLAIPQANERGDRLDWYAPFNGRVKSWLNASESERRQALAELESYQQTLNAMSQRALSADKPALKLFGALLSKAFQFPDRQYIYLVNGRPVLTFWGFVDLDKRSRSDALDCLRSSLQPDPQPLSDAPLISVPAPEILPVAPKPEPEPSPVPLPVAPAASVSAYQAITELHEEEEQVIEPPQPPTPKRSRRRLWIAAPLGLAIAAALAYNFWPHQPDSALIASEPGKPTEPLPAIKPRVVIPAAIQAQAVALHKTLPLSNAAVVAAPPEVPAPAEPTPAVVPAAKDDLVMPPDAVRVGSIKFLDGNWRVSLQLGNMRGFKAPSLRYQLRDGKGTATIIQGDGTRCKAETTAGLMSSGNLIINSRYTARCGNGTRYKMPQIVCKQGDGAAMCEAQFGSDAAYPMTIKRESK
ncbi:SrfA family protein [Mixta hanseatica]|uniref:SrfA family protein n=1 Tax=Mixta hanseatica TaxID=2872648 RepID=A0ABY4R525_9GAMM|nr:SrfA family protein [Mixta hanseatica]UQY42422.1 SrfA family protein [Mixta hanseatica]